MAYSAVNGVRTYFEVCGQGPDLVLLHAIPFDRRLWLFQVARLSQFFRVINVDLRGFGLSDKPETPFTLGDMANDVAGVCAAVSAERAVVMGCSIGSGVGILMGLEMPALVRGLVLVGGNSRPGGRIERRVAGFTSPDLARYRREHMRDLFAPGFDATPLGRWVFDVFDENSHTLSGQSIAQVFRARAGANMTPRLGGIAVPTLVVNGQHDNSLPAGLETAAGIPGAKHVVIADAGHACCLERPAAFEACVVAFLKERKLWPAAVDQA